MGLQWRGYAYASGSDRAAAWVELGTVGEACGRDVLTRSVRDLCAGWERGRLRWEIRAVESRLLWLPG